MPLIDLMELWELVDDRAALVTFVDEAMVAKSAPPEVRARAKFLRAQLYDRQGRPDEAAKLRASLGMADRFLVVGPFDNEGKAGHAQPFGPEKDLKKTFDAQASYEGKERKVGWRALPEPAGDGPVAIDPWLRPDAQVTAYATVAVRAPRAMKAALRIGSSGAVKAWLDGRLAIDREIYRAVHFDQEAAAVELKAGWNRIVIKVSDGDTGGLRIFARLSAPDGGPLDGLEWSLDAAHLAEAARATTSKANFPVVDLARELQAQVNAHPKDPDALTALGQYVRAIEPEDPEQHRAAALLADAARLRPSAEAWMRVADAEPDSNDRRHALDEGLALANQDGTARARLFTAAGELWDRARRERRAESTWRAALAADPDFFPAALALAELTADRGLPSRAATELSTVERAHPALKVLRAEAALAFRRGHRDDAEKILQRVADAARDDDAALAQLASIARTRGALDLGLGILDRLARAHTELPTSALERAEWLGSVGRYDDAHRALAGALAASPDDPKLLERDGRLLHRLGQDAPALEKLRRALELHPQNPELRAYIAELDAHAQKNPEHRAASDLAAAWTVDVRAQIARARADKEAPKADLPARVLYDQEVTRVHSNGLSESFQQRIVEILDDRGAREQGDFDVRFTPDTQTVELRAARVYKADGEVQEAVSTEEESVSDPSIGMYYDVRAQIIRFSTLQPGDVIDIEYVTSDIGRKNLFADYFGDLHFFQEELPRVEQRYVLIAPRARKLYFNTPRLDGLTHKEEDAGDERVYTFHAAHTPKTDIEPSMPGYSEIAPYVHVSTYRTWEDVATWYQGLVKGQLDPSPAIISAVERATRGVSDEREKIRALYDLVVRSTRYVALEFGIHGFQPYRVSQVFARKFGDCKDKASLLLVMLKQAGIDATLVLARTRQGGDLDATPASLAAFDHAIVYVPKYDLYLDGTAEFSGSEELPAPDQDIPVLRVSEGKLVRTPVLPAERNRVVSDWRVALDADGAARVDEHVVVAGEAAHSWRSHYQTPGERAERYALAWNGRHPGARLDKLAMQVDDLEKPVEARAIVSVPHWARPQAGEGGVHLAMPALGHEPDLLKLYARLSSRRYDLILGYPWRQEERVTVTLPSGFRALRLPEARTVEAPFGRFALAVDARGAEGECARAGGCKVVVTAQLTVDKHRIAKADYAAFRKFCADVDAAVAQELVVAGEAPRAAALKP